MKIIAFRPQHQLQNNYEVFVMRKAFSLCTRLLIALNCVILAGGYFALEAKAQNTDPSSTGTDSAAVNEHSVIEYHAWLDPLTDIPLNTQLLIGEASESQYLAVLSVDDLAPPSLVFEATNRQRKLVTQWSQEELRAYAYEIRDNCDPSGCSGNYTVTIDPEPVNQNLFPISEVKKYCGTAPFCSVSRGEPVFRTPAPLGRFNASGESVESSNHHQIQVLVGSAAFTLIGWEGIFEISPALSIALQQTSDPIKVMTPSGWEATINQEAVESVGTLYQ